MAAVVDKQDSATILGLDSVKGRDRGPHIGVAVLIAAAEIPGAGIYDQKPLHAGFADTLTHRSL